VGVVKKLIRRERSCGSPSRSREGTSIVIGEGAFQRLSTITQSLSLVEAEVSRMNAAVQRMAFSRYFAGTSPVLRREDNRFQSSGSCRNVH
jgi:hypothetical protein